MPTTSTARVWTPEVRMVALSFLVLYLELALIRFVSGYVHNFGYFTNFAMLGSFLGIGVGCLLSRRSAVIAWLPAILLALALIVRGANVQIDLPTTSQSAVFWSEALAKDRRVPITVMVLVLFALIAAVFVGPGQLLGSLFGELRRLRAYALNIAGGLAGILAFACNSRFEHPPLVWFMTAAVIAAPFLLEAPRWTRALNAVVLALCLWVVGSHTAGETWSPYYRQKVVEKSGGFGLQGNGVTGIVLSDLDRHADADMYAVPYVAPVDGLRKHPGEPFHHALVIGCGGGNDVAMGLKHGVLHIDAVDINPWVIEAGKRLHPLHPFDSPRVSLHVADGREFLARPGEKYDLIVYGLPDSTYTNDRANLRVESFLFTSEAFKQVLSRLSDDGVFVVYNYFRAPWLVEKIGGMLRDASGQEPFTWFFRGPNGELRRMLPAAMAVGPGLSLPRANLTLSPAPATDDWPFLYLTGPTIPAAYLGALGEVALLSLLLVLGALWLTRGERKDGRSEAPESRLVLAALFFMGLAFVLLETRSVVTFGLFFGSTWWNNVVVFAAIHVSVLLAILVNARFESIPRWAMAAALLGSLGVAWMLPPELLLVGSTATRAVLAGTVAFLPIFCANVLFASIFASTSEGRVSYAFNLLGGMLGGLLEYVSLLAGYRFLVGLATLFYLFALLFAYRYSLRGGERGESGGAIRS